MSKPDGPDTPAEQPTPEADERPLDFLDGKVEPAGPRRHRMLPLWAVAIIAVLIAGVGFVVFRYVLADDAPAECATVTGAGDTATVEPVSCADTAAFRIASRKDLSAAGCAEGAYREMRTDKELLCLMPNFVKGNCYVPDDPNQAFKVGPCDSPDAIKVVDELRDTSDPSPCPNGNGLGYPEPAVVFCLETPNTTGS